MGLAQVSFDVRITVNVRPDDVGFVSHCPVLDVFSQGATEQEALENIKEAVQLFIESCYMRGCLDQVLKDSGFELRSLPASLELSDLSGDESAVHVPLALIADAKNKERQANSR